MATGGAILFARTTTTAATYVLFAGLAAAQDAGGLTGTLTASQGLAYSSDDGASSRTNLGLDVSSVTRTQTFEIALNTGIDQALEDGLSVSAEDPSAQLSYAIQSRQTALTTDLSYSQTDADDLFNTSDGILDELVFDEGKRDTIGANLGLNFGREASFGGALSLGYGETNYRDTVSPDLIDTFTHSASLSLRYDIDRRITATVAYSWSDTDRATGRDVVNENLTLGAQLAVTPSLQADLTVGQRRISVTESGATTMSDGTEYAVDVTQTRPRGTLTYSLNSDISEAGRRTTATVGTTFETRRGTLAASFGLSESVNSSVRPLATLSYSSELPRGSYSVSLNQNFSIDVDGDETLNSRLQLAWEQDLNSTARISSDLAFQISDRLGTDVDTTRLELGLEFSHDLTQDWSVTTRYSHSIVDEDGSATSRENELFIGLETTLGWRS